GCVHCAVAWTTREFPLDEERNASLMPAHGYRISRRAAKIYRTHAYGRCHFSKSGPFGGRHRLGGRIPGTCRRAGIAVRARLWSDPTRLETQRGKVGERGLSHPHLRFARTWRQPTHG